MAEYFQLAENLRGEAMKFAVGLHRFPAEAADQELIWDGDIEDYAELLNTVQQRFLNRPDGAGVGANSTPARFQACVEGYLAGRLPRFHIQDEVFMLFIGHDDLFHRFEQLRFMNDRREETRRQIREWRDHLRQDFLYGIHMEQEISGP